ncbi:unnamed protein product [Spirodela intermedia]|uniref:Auxin-responsive protein n=1 Tax=Spirodela intermedia TaxID=51605 RepID=A0A7I8IM13_SPIIN|nr:unnamed protein product [Spirodela intermedia]CAA6658986.1 unnamed protein product [Spirodela intermedia]
MASTNRGGKRTLSEVDEESGSWGDGTDAGGAESGQDIAPATKTQVVGWPPIRSYRKNCLPGRNTENEAPGLYVKVRMDGAPYLRKIDLKAYKGYKDFREAMEGMFRCTSLERDVITYEDKDGDWMLAGDVPWEMFTSSCKRLRIMKWSEARGLRL